VILLDTNVISELIKIAPDPAVQRWYVDHADQIWLSSITIAESAYGIAKLDKGAKRIRLENQLTDWRMAYATRIHSFTANTAMLYGEIMAHARRNGHNMAVPDAQIAAIALELGCPLATRNGKDFSTTSIDLVDPWAD
jgi:predicted nucleic acid-binding protein